MKRKFPIVMAMLIAFLFGMGLQWSVETYWGVTSEPVTVAWDAVPNATMYKYEVRHLERELVYLQGETSQTQVPLQLSSAGHYVVRVTACNGEGCAQDGQGNALWHESTDPNVATVDGQARGWWIYRVLDKPSGIEFGEQNDPNSRHLASRGRQRIRDLWGPSGSKPGILRDTRASRSVKRE